MGSPIHACNSGAYLFHGRTELQTLVLKHHLHLDLREVLVQTFQPALILMLEGLVQLVVPVRAPRLRVRKPTKRTHRIPWSVPCTSGVFSSPLCAVPLLFEAVNEGAHLGDALLPALGVSQQVLGHQLLCALLQDAVVFAQLAVHLCDLRSSRQQDTEDMCPSDESLRLSVHSHAETPVERYLVLLLLQ